MRGERAEQSHVILPEAAPVLLVDGLQHAGDRVAVGIHEDRHAEAKPGFCGVLANAHELGCSQVANEGTITIAIKRGCVT